MRRTRLLLTGVLAVLLVPAAVAAQEPTVSETNEYALELPSPTWRALPRSDSVHQHTEFINGERSDGYLRVRKEIVEPDLGLSEMARRDQDLKLRYLPGFVGGKEERFAGRLSGITTSYEYTNNGKAMVGRIYYLKADNRTVYTLHFTGLRDKLQYIRNQTDAIARSFRVKQ